MDWGYWTSLVFFLMWSYWLNCFSSLCIPLINSACWGCPSPRLFLKFQKQGYITISVLLASQRKSWHNEGEDCTVCGCQLQGLWLTTVENSSYMEGMCCLKKNGQNARKLFRQHFLYVGRQGQGYCWFSMVRLKDKSHQGQTNSADFLNLVFS